MEPKASHDTENGLHPKASGDRIQRRMLQERRQLIIEQYWSVLLIWLHGQRASAVHPAPDPPQHILERFVESHLAKARREGSLTLIVPTLRELLGELKVFFEQYYITI